MFTFFKYEAKTGLKSFLIWTLAIALMGLACILMYSSMEENMAEMAENFASMGAFSDAFGMSTLSIATLKGFFATEIGTIHGLGGAMFAAALATNILSKEEDGHTAEFTYTLPVARGKVVMVKYIYVLAGVAMFTLSCYVIYELGILMVGGDAFHRELIRYMLAQLMLDIEVATICFLLSAASKKNKLGVGIGIAMILYLYDIIGRVVPDLKDSLFLTPFSYANASEIISDTAAVGKALGFGIGVTVCCVVVAYLVYTKRDLAS